MAHGERAARKSNKQRDYWSRRPTSNHGGSTRNSLSKNWDHRMERRAAKKMNDQ